MEDIDYSLLPSNLIAQIFPKNNVGKEESVVFMQKCKKYNRYGISQERIFVLSTNAAYLFSKNRVHTKVEMSKLKYIIKSMHSKEFMLQFTEGVDLRLSLEDREDLLMMVKMRFANICPN